MRIPLGTTWLLCWPLIAPAAELSFQVRFSPAVAPKQPVSGRLVLALAPAPNRPSFTDVDPPVKPILGVDVNNATANSVITLNADSLSFPAQALKTLPPGDYNITLSLMVNPNLLGPRMPGNYFGEARNIKLEPNSREPISLQLEGILPEVAPMDTATFKYHSLKSSRLSEFHAREVPFRFGVCLPKDFQPNGQDTYGLVIWIGGFGSRATSARRLVPDSRFVQIYLDGAGPFGDPYQVNSANNGPYGDALIHEVLPFMQKQYRAGLSAKQRFLTGSSTGGWVSLALQVFYPDQFNGCWSQCPDGVDFRAFQLINIYRDDNAYLSRTGFERPAKRTIEGDIVYSVRHECQLERVLGRGGRWELGGQQWASWNAVYGPRGADGLPAPLWDGTTGRIHRDVAKHWEKYDLTRILDQNWAKLGPQISDKIHIWVGDADDYFLNNAVHRLQAMLATKQEPAFRGVIEIAPRQGHTNGWSRTQVLDAMAARMK